MTYPGIFNERQIATSLVDIHDGYREVGITGDFSAEPFPICAGPAKVIHFTL